MSFVNLIIILKIGKMIEKKSTAISFKKHAIFSKVNVELDLHSSDVGDVITLAHTSGKLPIIVRDWKGNTGSKMCSAPHHTTPNKPCHRSSQRRWGMYVLNAFHPHFSLLHSPPNFFCQALYGFSAFLFSLI